MAETTRYNSDSNFDFHSNFEILGEKALNSNSCPKRRRNNYFGSEFSAFNFVSALKDTTLSIVPSWLFSIMKIAVSSVNLSTSYKFSIFQY